MNPAIPSMQLFVVIAGLDDFAPSVRVEPHDTIETLVERLEKRLDDLDMPPQFTAAYSLAHNRDCGLRRADPDFVDLQKGDLIVMAQYFTPAARLVPNKTVADYFGYRVMPRTVSIALTWPPESLAYVYRLRDLADQDYFQRRQARARANAAATRAASAAVPPSVTATMTMTTTTLNHVPASEPAVEHSCLLLEMAVGCLPLSALSRWWWTTTMTDAKKHD